jgi:hypothetical protein
MLIFIINVVIKVGGMGAPVVSPTPHWYFELGTKNACSSSYIFVFVF